MRGALDLYTRFVCWQADRRAHRQSAAEGTAPGAAPQFTAYFDPVVDTVAAIVHSVMGAGAAVLFGTTGQISGGYAALVVGVSAPMLLTQLGRIQTVNEAVTGERSPAGAATETEAPIPTATGAVGVGGAGDPGAVGSLPRVVQRSMPTAELPNQPTASEEGPHSSVSGRRSRSPAQPPRLTDTRRPEPVFDELSMEHPQLPDSPQIGDTPLPAVPPDTAGPGLDGPGAPRWRPGPALGEERP
ncbi:hypothetical protein [Streptomyces sp. NPDC046371]|uniref:hypothetical protein n=1 Tax=Streptomyces sp. NPDC046371 TaxID=3154916 RepID=UPI0033E15DFC